MPTLLHYPHHRPDLAILAIVLVVVTGLAMGAPFVGKHLFKLSPDATRAAAAFDAFKAVMA